MPEFHNIRNSKIDQQYEKDMIIKTLTMAFPFWKRQYPHISLENQGGKLVLVDYKNETKVVWNRRPLQFFQQIRSSGMFQ